MKRTNLSIWRTKTDKLLQDYIRTAHKGELCWVCGERPIVCGHHFVPCSNSNALRYYIPNLIPICKEDHSKVHCQPHLVEPGICFKLGEEWYNDLMERKRQLVKANIGWYKFNYQIITELMEDLK